MRHRGVVILPKPRPEDVAADFIEQAPAPPSAMPQCGLGATYVAREYADQTVQMLADRGIVSEVIPEGRYFRVKVYPLPPKGTH